VRKQNGVADVGVIDYGTGNIQSISNAFERIGVRVRLVHEAAQLAGATHLVLPGVGAFGFCLERLRATGLLPALEAWVFGENRPLLGVCVGMQLLAETSDEHGTRAGLGWIPGRVTMLRSTGPCIRIPHVGWNTVRFAHAFGEFSGGSQCDFYFDHSYAYEPAEARQTLASCSHGERFTAAIRDGNVVGVQFHPEKSQVAGIRFLRGFVAM
jgi:glutamine amidotransferase